MIARYLFGLLVLAGISFVISSCAIDCREGGLPVIQTAEQCLDYENAYPVHATGVSVSCEEGDTMIGHLSEEEPSACCCESVP